ncbi:MAG: sigma-70 family RNA polymerase sigma factor [Candidatus Limiplasma sp.]|nr:sigma-70 family RNA polymerase sigma factor [Candidatus Limiplasma sp.]
MSVPSELNGRIHHAVQAHMQSVVRVAYAYLRHIQDAEDIAQDTFLAYLRSGKRFGSSQHEKAWLLRVCINKSKNLLKSGWHKNRNPLPEGLPALSQEEDSVLSAVMGLEEKYRLPIHLYYYEGYAIKDIARALSLPAATVGTRLARAKARLKQQLGGAFDEE